MAVNKTFANQTFSIPQNKDPKSTNWGTQVSNFLQTLADYALPRTGGDNQLTAEMNFSGASFVQTYGLKAAYLKGALADASLPSAGFLRLGNAQTIQWKGSVSDLSLSLSGSDRLQFAGTDIYQPSDAASANTVSKLVLRDSNGDFSAGTITATSFNGPITGNAATATKWQTARTITLGTDLSGSVSIDGSADVTLNATIAANSVALGTDTSGDYVSSLTGTANQVTVTGGTGESSTPVLSLPQDIASTSSPTFANVTISNTPTNSTHAATKGYVDTIAQGLDVKASVKAATTANITLSGTQTIDGVALSVDDRVLVKNQSTQADNGFYLVKSSTWQRTTDADAWDELIGAFVFVEQGTTLADTGWVCTVNAGGTLGSTAVTFSQFSGVGSYQPLDATLTALAAYNTNGFIVQTATDTFAGRSLAAGTGISITNTDGFSGNPSIAIDSTVATLTGSQTLTNKTLDAAIIDNAALMLHETSVSTPSSGRIALYPKSDNKLYIKDSTGVETAVGTGSGGGVINYILNPDAESNTTGWATYADAAGTTPVDGTGGSPSVTWTRNTTTPLRGNADFAFAKDAANRQGQGVSYDFTISSVDKGRKLSVSFDYNSNTTNYSAGDILVYLYDVTNSILITPSSTSLPKNTGTLTVNFDSTTSTSYRLILHVSTTNATAYTLYFDNFQVGPGQIVQGAAISEWQSYTPTGSWSTNVNYSGWYRRTGSSMDWRGKVAATATLSGTTQLTMTLPLNLTVTSSGLTTNGRSFLGKALVTTSSSTRRVLAFCYGSNGSNNITFEYHSQNANTDTTLNTVADVSQTTPFTMNNGDFVEGYIEGLPIAEWVGNGTVSLGAGAQVEWAYNTDASSTATVTASGFAAGTAGVSISSNWTTNTTFTRRVRFQYPIQADDVVNLELNVNGKWAPLGELQSNLVSNGIRQGANSYGISIAPVSGSDTDFDVTFNAGGARPDNITYAGNGSTFSNFSAYSWRVRKAKASSPVGFGLAGTDGSAGLYKPGQAPGQATNTTIGSGYIGERLSSNSVGVNVAATTAYANICSVTLTPGVWCVSAQYSLGLGTITGWTYCQVNISTSSSTNDSNNNGGFVAYTPGSSTSSTGSPYTGSVGNRFISVASGSTTPVYLVGRIDYTTQSSSTWTVNNRIDAVRIA